MIPLFATLTIIAWCIIAIQVIYLVSLLIGFGGKQVSGPPYSEGVSIIVCAHDEERNLRELIPLLLRQRYDRFEVIIVEDRCNDGTFDYLLKTTKEDQRLKMVRVQHLPEHVSGKKFALTLGVKAASYPWVLLTDADCRPASENWIRSMTTQFDDARKIVLGYSPYVKVPGYLNSFVRFESLVTGIEFMGLALLGRPYMGTGRNLAYRRTLFFDSKGFNKHLHVTGGDDDLFVNEHARKANTAVTLGKESLMYSLPKKTWREFYYQKLRHLSVGKHYKFSDKLVLGIFSFTWILSWLLVVPVMVMADEAVLSFLWTGFVLRQLLLIGLVYRASRTLGDAFEAWKTPVLDFNYAIYYLGTGLVALVSKRVRWKK